MHKQLFSFEEGGSENDKGTEINVSLFEFDNGISLTISLEHVEDEYGSFSTKSEEEIEITGLTEEQLHSIQNLIDEFLESVSRATIMESVQGIEGEYVELNNLSGRNGKPRERDFQFDELLVNVGEVSLSLSGKKEDGDYEGVKVPSAKRLESVPQDVEILRTINNVFYEFLINRYSGDITGLDIEQPDDMEVGAVSHVELIFDRFGEICDQLRERDRGRDPLTMDDEYDVQYLLHGLLRLYFDDVRDETYLSRVATKSPRIDFLLEEHDIGIEVKRASETRPVRRLLTEISEDKEVYRKDPLCDTLLVFIYDPERTETNPAEVEKDLSEATKNLTTRVKVTR
ncbi:hypothetical protein N0B31_18640 [Salinirubellus salinus]|uniref:Uncharacterized protein n=1 Tax=Salinirubellus salinus TaxID=1364945 RepID=A0A9E7U7Z6_9EURY|nr:hypothetical protein [Salinirubellus salinus]UWM54121.1 hypothetical protein N0B31_18640 [Salinirubellus salinus]